jgi:hypothetical protein
MSVSNQPIFIVGVPRSGTTLLAAMLAAHSRISCGPETHFFRKLAHIDADQLLLPASWPGAAVDFVCSIEHASYFDRKPISLLNKYQIDRKQIEAYLQRKEPSLPNILASVTETFQVALGKERWAEKTPDHILTLGQIRKHFPDSPVIRIIRDPRDVAISLTKVPWGAMSFLEALMLWKRLDEQSDGFFQTDRLCYSLRYEDLITCPDEELARLCRFIGEDFEPGMLDTSETGKQLNARNVPWKDKVSQPVDASNVAIWKDQLSGPDLQLAEAILGDRLEAQGYARAVSFNRLGVVYPRFSLVTKYAQALTGLASGGIRLWKTTQDERAAAKIYLGDPMSEGWLVGNKISHLLEAGSILLDLFKARQSKQDIYWIAGSQSDAWTGYSAALLKKALSPYRYPDDESRG